MLPEHQRLKIARSLGLAIWQYAKWTRGSLNNPNDSGYRWVRDLSKRGVYSALEIVYIVDPEMAERAECLLDRLDSENWDTIEFCDPYG